MSDWPKTDGAAPGDWVRRYLRLLGVEHAAPGLSALTALTQAQVLRVPFANTAAIRRRRAHLGRPAPPVDPEALLTAWEQGTAGGVCFEVVTLFSRLLTALGYQARVVLGRIGFPASHLAIQVAIESRAYLVDAGNGAPFLAPIPLDEPTTVQVAGLRYRFRADVAPGTWVQDRWIEGAWASFCYYDLGPPDAAVREAGYQRHHTPGETWVVGTLTLIRSEANQVFVLRDTEFTHFAPDGKRSERLAGPAEQARIAAEVFRWPALPIGEALAALAELRGASR